MRRVLLLLALLAAGCTGPDAFDGPVPERWRMDRDARMGPWEEDPRVEPALRIDAPRAAAPDARFNATVVNGLDETLVGGGTDCGLFLARGTPDGWLVFAPFPGNYHDMLLRIPPGDECRADLDLAMLTGEPPATGAYRLVHLSRVGDVGGRVVLGWAPLEVRND